MLASHEFPFAWNHSEGKYLTLGFPNIHLSHLREILFTQHWAGQGEDNHKVLDLSMEED